MRTQRPDGTSPSGSAEEAPTLGKPLAGTPSAPVPLEAAPPCPPPGHVLAERYTVLNPLGHGGMGVVLAAYDARLNRRVALKLLRPRWEPEDDGASQVRLLREAQAMAQLNHPHVVHVYDSGRLEDDAFFIAMEYVEGRTLRQWLQQQPRTWREVLRAFLEAGRGLAAAHAAGLVHRDFKPDNVLVGQDGRVRVTDFGVAQALHPPEADTQAHGTERALPRTWVEPLTESGRMMGTPRYMAPEQLQGRPVDARSDLYAFCVALYEALYGQRPFAGDSQAELLEARLAERIAPAQSEVPAWVGRAVLRGLRADPLQRPGSLRELLEELENDPRQRWRARVRTGALAGGGALLLVLAIWGWVRQEAPDPACGGMDRRMAGIWDAPLRKRLEQALLGTGLPQAQDTFERVSRLLDAYASGWVKQRTEACELARQEGADRLPRLAALREYCLERRRGQLGALTELLAREPDPKLLDGAVQAVQSLYPLSDCADARLLTAVVPPPEDPAVRARAETLEQQVDRLAALHVAGRYAEGLALADTLRPQVAALEHPSLRARVLFWSASLRDGAGDYKGAEAALREALVLSAQGKDALMETRAWNLLVTVVGTRQARHAEALWLELPLRAAAERLGDERQRALMHEALGTVRWTKGDSERAREDFALALALLEKLPGPNEVDLSRLLNSMGNVLLDLGQYERARGFFERSMELKQKALGPEHPSLASSINNLGLVHEALGHSEQAQAQYERAVALKRKTLGPNHPSLASSLANLGDILRARGHLEEALARHERALELRLKALGPEHPSVSDSYTRLGHVLADLGRDAEARTRYERALAIQEKLHGPGHVETATVCAVLGRTLVRLGRWDEAARFLRRAQATGEQLSGQGPGPLAQALLGWGEWHLARNRPAQAVPLLERALSLTEERSRAEVRWLLAQALWKVGAEPARARDLATQAQEFYRKMRQERQLARVSQWLMSHPR
ncbi:tetratricopeptide repeat protein [Archangium gephyra]|uniref:tetratricopeptide repeat protein n=1 Tax=Archangium gephyra TaxID=48 RepID=UPI0035D50B8C